MAHNKKVPGSSPGWARMPFFVEFACSPHVWVGFLWVLRFPPQSKDMPCRWSGQRKLAVVSECVCEWVCPSTGVARETTLPIKKKQHNLSVRIEPFPLFEFSSPLGNLLRYLLFSAYHFGPTLYCGLNYLYLHWNELFGRMYWLCTCNYICNEFL